MNDLRFAFRQLLKNPGFTAVAVLTLALWASGRRATVFSLVQGVLLTPPPYPQPDRLVLITPTRTDGQRYTRRLAGGAMAGVADRSPRRSKPSRVIGGRSTFWCCRMAASPSRAWRVTRDYFKVTGIQPALGRAFDDPIRRTGHDGDHSRSRFVAAALPGRSQHYRPGRADQPLPPAADGRGSDATGRAFPPVPAASPGTQLQRRCQSGLLAPRPAQSESGEAPGLEYRWPVARRE